MLNVHECADDAGYAGVVAATRTLSKDYRVVVDGSTNAVPNRLLRTKHQKVLQMGPMSLEVMETVPDFRHTFALLKELSRFELVWAVCGGNPADMGSLRVEMHGARFTPEGRLTAESARQLGAAVDEFAMERVRQAIGRVTELVTEHPELEDLLKMFTTVDKVTPGVVRKNKFVRPHDDKVLRTGDTTGALVPADAATALVLRHGLTEMPSIEELRKLAGQVRCACDCARQLLGDFHVTFKPLTLPLSSVLPTPVLHRRPRKIEVQQCEGGSGTPCSRASSRSSIRRARKRRPTFSSRCRCS